ncbi:alcohol dehydrogenase catalytic domain-containing protein [Actinotalea sp. M2MS4P-6]|uniref:zinc-dependent alcohol dehydrogenase n=1 Tax=Actinotalea sp. M2MS4P-6 TaxID=2983762 RepID=UPI0021E46B20|nr:alcohol dehydrogenase catalytic domain-containing protein [Actinotalea sp. M2MS4P-6]MCV2394249.1 alcohol dehydrogenase catalytic domain-containing protein [Actinotalea sp. M2MS4P-6]
MRVARLHGPRDLRITDEPAPDPGPGESLVRVEAVGICGSDLHWWSEGTVGETALSEPMVIGHETAGRVVGGPLDGRLVAVDPAIPCGRCERCLQGDPNLCPSIRFAGHGPTDGSMQELIAWPTDRLVPLSDSFTAVDGAVLEPLGVAIHALDLAHLKVGDTAVVAGLGPIGLLLVQLLRSAGAARVIGIEPLAHRREAALTMGADVVAHPDDLTDDALRADLLAGRDGADRCFEVAGEDDAIASCVTLARPGARVALVGIPATVTSHYPAAPTRRKGLTLALVRRMKDVYPRAISLAERGAVDVRAVVTSTHGLTDAATALADAASRAGLKAVVTPQVR